MSDDINNVINMPTPKSTGGYSKNLKWNTTFNTKTGQWDWRVEHTPNPNVFKGTADTHADAVATVNDLVKTLR